ncbi:MAG: hypothetical protein KDI37_07065 [Xanthomonadales bacterium]|nr:hypothetical protein [Xanthomonadales bacterium]
MSQIELDVQAALESERHALIRHEVQLRDAGLLCYCMAALALFLIIRTLLIGELAESALLCTLCLVLLPIYLVVGRGFRRLDPWVRFPAAVMAFLGLLGQPTGWMVFSLIRSERGDRVLSPGYRKRFAATPQVHVQRRWSDWRLVFMTSLMVVAIALAVASL